MARTHAKLQVVVRTSLRGWLLALLVVCAGLPGAAGATDDAKDARASVPLDHLPALRGDYFALDSKTIGRTFHIYVRLPQEMDADASRRYPVVYLLDGDSLFPILAANHLFLTYDDGLPEAIVVGIAYGGFDPAVNKRGYDFSAPAADALEGQGGADDFLTFLRSELLPRIEQRYPADPEKRILFGQSRGAHFVLYSALVEPDLFWGRIASNPTLEPGRARFFQAANAATRDDLGLVLTSGERDRPALRADALAWDAAWRERADAPWAFRFHTIPDGTHAADSPHSYRAGMSWLFGDRNAEGDDAR